MNKRRSVPIAAGIVLLLIVAVLGAGLLYLRRDSASVGPVAAPASRTPIAQPTPMPSPTAVPAPASATQAPTATPQPAPTARAVVITVTPAPRPQPAGPPPGATLIAEIRYFVVNGTQVAIYPGTPTPVIPWWQLDQTGTDEQVKALIAGYLHFWDVRAQALYTLDTALISQVMTGRPLDDELAAIYDFRANHQSQFVDVDHAIAVLWAAADEGAVMDTFGDRSYMVDLNATPEPQPRHPPNPYRMAYRLRRSPSGTWQVIDSVKIVR